MSNVKVPKRANNSRVDRALQKVAQDGQWHRILEMGFTSAEQTARAYNVPGGQWEFGYTHEPKGGSGDIISVLWARWI